MLESLTGRLGEVFRRLRDRGKLSVRDVEEALGEVRTSLLEADVPTEVADPFLERVRAEAVGRSVLENLAPGRQILEIVYREMVDLLGPPFDGLKLGGGIPRTVLLVGPQGSGKTTTSAKLARWFQSQGRRPLLVGTDTRRPAALGQLERLGRDLGIPVGGGGDDPRKALAVGLDRARAEGWDPVVVDTAGRFETQEGLMEEVGALRRDSGAHEVLLVVDGLLGREGIRIARSFDAAVGLTGAVVTKMEGDARGGILLAFRSAVGKPIRFLGTGEGIEALEPFRSDRLASRILGMGDLATLAEEVSKAQSEAALPARPPHPKAFGLEEFLGQLRGVKSMGPLDRVLGMIPGMGGVKARIDTGEAAQTLKKSEAIILSMTPKERRRPEILDGSRRRRIARGSGTRVEDVNRLVKQYLETRKLMKQMGSGGRGLGSLLAQARRGR